MVGSSAFIFISLLDFIGLYSRFVHYTTGTGSRFFYPILGPVARVLRPW